MSFAGFLKDNAMWPITGTKKLFKGLGSFFGVGSSASSMKDEILDAIDGTTQAENNALIQSLIQQQMDYQTNSAQTAMKFEAEQAQLNRDFQENLSNTSVQRRVADLKAAGLNPILAVSNGIQGADTPSGSTASGHSQAGSIAQIDTYNQLFSVLGAMVDAVNAGANIVGTFKK